MSVQQVEDLWQELHLRDEVDASRGDVIARADAPAEVADQFEVTVVWMNEQPLLRGRSYLMKVGAKTTNVTISPVKYKINVNTLEHVAAEKLELNEIGVCELELDRHDLAALQVPAGERVVCREPVDVAVGPELTPQW